MKNKTEKTNKYKTIIVSTVIGAAVTLLFITIFAAIMYFLGLEKMYSTIFATAAVAFGCFAASFYASTRTREKGLLIGAVTGGVTFVLVLIISFIKDSGAVTLNTLFHFIIFMLSSLVGGVIGVNKSENKKYIK